MIVFDLECHPAAHRFEGWFASSEEFTRQRERGLVACPACGSIDVAKAVMAPNLARKGNQLPEPARHQTSARTTPAPVAPPAPTAPAVMTNNGPTLTPEAAALLQALASAQAEALKASRWVGETFADQARAMHYGERTHEPIHGQATADEARELIDEGIEVAPILFPVVPPGEAN
jgi:hypothetical protein